MSSLADEFPPQLFWCVDEFSTVVIVDQLRGVCPLSNQFRLYLDRIPATSMTTAMAVRARGWKQQTGYSMPSHMTLRDLATAIAEQCNDSAETLLGEFAFLPQTESPFAEGLSALSCMSPLWSMEL